MVFSFGNDNDNAATLNDNGVLELSQLPDLSVTSTTVVPDQPARLALNAEEGDVAIQTDVDQTFILSTNDPTVNANWKQIQLDVLGAVEGKTILPAQTGTSTNRTTMFADTVDTNQLSGVATGGALTATRARLTSSSTASPLPFVVSGTGSFDPDNNFSSPAYIAPAAGTYQIHLHKKRQNDADFDATRIEKNGSVICETGREPGNNFPSGASSFQTLTKASQGDSFRVINPNNNSFAAFNPGTTFFEVLRLE
jgi:hypothetical protein